MGIPDRGAARTALIWLLAAIQLMRTKTILVSLLVAVSCIASVIVPFLLAEKFAAPLSTGGSLLSAVASIVTMVLAFMLFRRFGIEQQTLDRQLGAVSDVLADLNKCWVSFHGIFGKKTNMVRIHAIDPAGQDSEEDAHPIMVTRALLAVLEQLAAHRSSVFLPISIARTLDALHIVGWARFSKPDGDPIHWKVFAIAATSADPNDEIIGIDLMFLGCGGRYGPLTIAGLRSKLTAVVDAIDSWHTKHAGPERMLNIARHRYGNPSSH